MRAREGHRGEHAAAECAGGSHRGVAPAPPGGRDPRARRAGPTSIRRRSRIRRSARRTAGGSPRGSARTLRAGRRRACASVRRAPRGARSCRWPRAARGRAASVRSARGPRARPGRRGRPRRVRVPRRPPRRREGGAATAPHASPRRRVGGERFARAAQPVPTCVAAIAGSLIEKTVPPVGRERIWIVPPCSVTIRCAM